jgi:hypothetical protein
MLLNYNSIGFLFLAWLSAGCSQIVNVNYSASNLTNQNSSPGIDTKILIQPPIVSHQQQYDQSGLFVVGMLNNWQVDFNHNISDAVRDAVGLTFENTVVGSRCDDCGLIVRPRISQIDIDKLSMQASVELKIDFLDALGRKVVTFESGGRSAVMDATRFSAGVVGYFIPFLGTAVGTHLVKETVKEALDESLAQLAKRIEQQANSGILARTWLPKNDLLEKRIGNHQYTAELVAISEGCNILSDGIRLVSQEYFKESYRAKCWGKPTFTIDCEYGRCQLAPEDGHIAQSAP